MFRHDPSRVPRPESERATHVRYLLEIASRADPFRSDLGQAFVSISGGANGHAVFPARSANFRDWLVRCFYELHATAPNPDALRQVIQAVYARAATAPDSDPVCYRTASVGTSAEPVLALDLAGPEGWMIEISRSRWQILENPLHSFRRNRGCLELPQPIAPEDLSACLAAFRPAGPFPILILNGPAGSGKSTAARLLRSLIDPSTAPLYPLPSSERGLRANARSTWVLAFDNVYRMSRPVSEALCRLSTGDGFLRAERFEARGFEDRHPFRANLQRPSLLTVRREDAPVWIPPPSLASRAFMVYQPPIAPPLRRTEFDIGREFAESRPWLLGALCTALSLALDRFPGVRLDNPHICADAAAWAIAAAPALGLTEDAVRSALEPDAPVPADPVAATLCAFLDSRTLWEGSATELMDLLRPWRDDSWPRTPKGLSQRLSHAAPSIQEAGLEIEFTRGRDSRRIRVTHRGPRCVTLQDN